MVAVIFDRAFNLFTVIFWRRGRFEFTGPNVLPDLEGG